MREFWAVAQTISKMEHLVRRDIEKTDRGTFLPTYARHWKVDGREYAKEYPLLLGYVFFRTNGKDWAGLPDINGCYRVLSTAEWTAAPVTDQEMERIVLAHAAGNHNETRPSQFTKYYRPFVTPKRKSRKPRPGHRIRNLHNMQISSEHGREHQR